MTNQKTIVGILGSGGDGGTLIEWSLHYLSGQTEYCCIPVDRKNVIDENLIGDKKIVTLKHDPLTRAGNAHGHLKTHPTITATPYVIEEFDKLDSGLFTFYTVSAKHDHYRLRPQDKSSGLKTLQKKYNEFNETYKDVKFIRLLHDTTAALAYTERYIVNFLAKQDEAFAILETHAEQRWYLLNIVYAMTISRTKKWSEFLFNEYPNQYMLHLTDVFYNLENKMPELLAFVNREIDTARLENWRCVYAEWQQLNGTGFYQNIDTIVDKIANGESFDLSMYTLNIAREAALIYKLNQQGIIVQHRDLEYMPLDTADWQSLLSIRQN
jgi:hypothetical protein